MEHETRFEDFIVTARKWRPLHFKDVVGQDHITTTLRNAITNKRIHHAYLFSGPRGVGKTTTARILARAVNCLNPDGEEPCNECASCLPILEGRSLDVIEIDGASNNSVDDIRKLRENAKYPPAAGNYKLYIIDEVHMLSTSAFNALLKTLEEPPPHLMFVFATTESHKLPATILSRCQRFEFHRMEIDKITGQLRTIAKKEGIEIDDESLITIAKKADGSMRDSQSIFDQVVAFCGKKIEYSEMADALHLIDVDFYFRITNAVTDRNLNEMFSIAKEVIVKGYDFQECLSGLLEHLRNLLTVRVTGRTDLIDSSGSYLNKYDTESKKFSKADLLRLMNIASTTEQALRFAPQPRIRFEMALVQMASLDNSIEITELLSELKELKKKPLNVVNGSNSAPQSAKNFEREPVPEFKSNIQPVIKSVSDSDLSLDENLLSLPTDVQEIQENILAATPELVTGTDSGKKITEQELKKNWKTFVEKYATADSDISALKQYKVIKPEFFNGEIILKTANEFLTGNLEKKKTALSNALLDFFKVHVKLKIITDESVGNGTIVDVAFSDSITIDLAEDFVDKEIEPPSSTDVNSSHKDISGKHPIEKTIVELFNAKEIKRNSH